MGRTVINIIVENVEDRERADRGEITRNQIRHIGAEALVDPCMPFLAMPESMIRTLDLKFHRKQHCKTASGYAIHNIYYGARIIVDGRSITDEVLGLPGNRQALLGEYALERLDFQINIFNH